MAIGRVNVASVDVENLSIFEIDTSVDTINERSFNVFSQVGTDSTRHEVYTGTGGDSYRSYGRKGNILFLRPIKEDGVWWVIEYDFEKGGFIKQQEVDLGSRYGSVKVENDFNKIRMKSGVREKIVIIGDIKTSNPKYGAWVSDDMSVSFTTKSSDSYYYITYYKNGNEEMFNIAKYGYFSRGFIFVNDNIAIVTTKDGELEAVKIHDVNNFTKQKKNDYRTLVGGFGGFGSEGQGYQYIYNATNDTFLDINTKTGHTIEKRFIYKSVDW